MSSVSGSYTLEKWERLPRDGNRYELLDGELLVTPSPGPLHQTLVARLTVALASYVDAHHLGQVWPGLEVVRGARTGLAPAGNVGREHSAGHSEHVGSRPDPRSVLGVPG